MFELVILVLIVAGVVFWARGRRRRVLSVPSRPQLTGTMAGLAGQALSEINSVLGPANGQRGQQTYQEVADFLAAMRYYRVAFLASYTDDLISAGLSTQPAVFIAKAAARYRQLPPGSDRDQAIAILQWVDQYPAAGVIVGMARLTIEKLQAEGS